MDAASEKAKIVASASTIRASRLVFLIDSLQKEKPFNEEF
jgi:hypothetical protein